MVPVDPVNTGITLVFTCHMRWISILSYYYYYYYYYVTVSAHLDHERGRYTRASQLPFETGSYGICGR